MKKLLKDPVLGWFCNKCYEQKSHKHYAFINAITLKCSLCDENLERKSYTMAGGSGTTMAECPNGHTQIALPECLCGEKMIYCPNAVVHHKMGQSIKKVKDNNYLIYIQCCVFYTYFKLMPLRSILYHLPFIIFKYTIVIIVDLLFLRISSFKRISTALLLSYKDRKRISKARKSFFRVNSVIRSTKEINSELTFFLWFDIKRFLKYVIMNNKSLLEE